jgi:hypothetical protein
MSDLTERRLGWGLGVLGGLLIIAAALVSVLVSTADLVAGRPMGALSAGSEAILLFVVGVLAALFSYLAYRPWHDHPVSAGVLLVVLAIVGWAVLGLGGSVLALVGALLVLLAGLLFLVQPAVTGARRVLATA